MAAARRKQGDWGFSLMAVQCITFLFAKLRLGWEKIMVGPRKVMFFSLKKRNKLESDEQYRRHGNQQSWLLAAMFRRQGMHNGGDGSVRKI